MNFDDILYRWREGQLTDNELRQLDALLATEVNRRALRDEWFLDAALPEALRTAAVARLVPAPGWRERLAGYLARLGPQPLLLWSRCSLAAVPLGAAAVLI